MSKQKILIYGAGGHGIVVADIIKSMQAYGRKVEVRGFLDDNDTKWNRKFMGIPVLGSSEKLKEFSDDLVVVAVGENAIRKKIVEILPIGYDRYFTAIHPSAVISPSVLIGNGSMVCAKTVVNPETHIGDHVILNTGCTVDHHNKIGDYVHLAPGVHTGGDVGVGKNSFLGIGASVLPGRKIGNNVMIGAGSVVTRNVDDGLVARGIPAKAIRRREEE